MQLFGKQIGSAPVQWETKKEFDCLSNCRLSQTLKETRLCGSSSPVSVYYISSDEESQSEIFEKVDTIQSPSICSNQTIVLSSSSEVSSYSFQDILLNEDAATTLGTCSESSYQNSVIGISADSGELDSLCRLQHYLNSSLSQSSTIGAYRDNDRSASLIGTQDDIAPVEDDQIRVDLTNSPATKQYAETQEHYVCDIQSPDSPQFNVNTQNRFSETLKNRRESHQMCAKRKRNTGYQRERKRRRTNNEEDLNSTKPNGNSSGYSIEYSETGSSSRSEYNGTTTSADSYTQQYSDSSESTSCERLRENDSSCFRRDTKDSPSDSKYAPSMIDVSKLRFKLDSNNNPIILGEGTTARVFYADYQDQYDVIHEVAIKVYFDADLYNYLMREARYLNFLEDTGFTPKCFGVVKLPSPDKCAYGIVQQFFGEGMTLLDFMEKRNSPLYSCESIQITAQLFLGLTKIHNKNMLINDIKENNILIDPVTLQVKFIDFNLASYDTAIQFDKCASLKHRHFLAPEVREGGSTSTMSDIYSLGHVLHRLSESLGTENMRYWSTACRYKDWMDRIEATTAIMVLRNHVKYAYTCICQRCMFSPGAFIRECDRILM